MDFNVKGSSDFDLFAVMKKLSIGINDIAVVKAADFSELKIPEAIEGKKFQIPTIQPINENTHNLKAPKLK